MLEKYLTYEKYHSISDCFLKLGEESG